MTPITQFTDQINVKNKVYAFELTIFILKHDTNLTDKHTFNILVKQGYEIVLIKQ